MAVKKVLLLVRVFSRRTCDLRICTLSLQIRSAIDLEAFKKLLGSDVEAYFYTSCGEKVPVFGMLEHIYTIIHVEEKPRKATPARGHKSCLSEF